MMTRFMEDTIDDKEIVDLHTEQRLAEYRATDPDHVFRDDKPFRAYIPNEA